MAPVHILGRDALHDRLAVKVTGQRKADHEALHARVAVQAVNEMGSFALELCIW